MYMSCTGCGIVFIRENVTIPRTLLSSLDTHTHTRNVAYNICIREIFIHKIRVIVLGLYKCVYPYRRKSILNLCFIFGAESQFQ